MTLLSQERPTKWKKMMVMEIINTTKRRRMRARVRGWGGWLQGAPLKKQTCWFFQERTHGNSHSSRQISSNSMCCANLHTDKMYVIFKIATSQCFEQGTEGVKRLKVIHTNAMETEHIFAHRWELGCWPKARGEPGAGSPGAAAACAWGAQNKNGANRKRLRSNNRNSR